LAQTVKTGADGDQMAANGPFARLAERQQI
jgi:hypothetical protein